jgi:hypothetical protein
VIRANVGAAPAASGPRALTLRIAEPFGAEHPIAQILLEVREADGCSPCVTRETSTLVALAPPANPLLALASPRAMPRVVAVIAVLVTILFALFGR